MKPQLTYEYRLYPNRRQEEQIRKIYHAVRFIYNKLLEDRTDHYRKTGKWKQLDSTELLKAPFLKGIDPGALKWAENSLETAYRNFFHTERTVPDRYRGESIVASQKNPHYKLMDTDLISYPRYKRRKTAQESYTTPLKEFAVAKNRASLPCVGAVKIRYHRPIPEGAEILCGTILKKPSGHYFLLVKFYLPEVPERKQLQVPLGIAFKPGQLAVRSDGVEVYYRHQDPQLQKRIEQAYKTLKRRKPGSQRYEKQRQYLASLYEHRANQRRDDLHKTARQIINVADAIYMQKADVRKQLRSLESRDAREALLDEATWTFSYYVKYKTELEGKWFWSVPRECLMDAICSGCNTLQKMGKAEWWVCPSCGRQIGWHENIAANLQALGAQYIRNLNQ